MDEGGLEGPTMFLIIVFAFYCSLSKSDTAESLNCELHKPYSQIFTYNSFKLTEDIQLAVDLGVLADYLAHTPGSKAEPDYVGALCEIVDALSLQKGKWGSRCHSMSVWWRGLK